MRGREHVLCTSPFSFSAGSPPLPGGLLSSLGAVLFTAPFSFIRKERSCLSEQKLERDFQRKLIQKLKARFPGCLVLKQDPDYLQGIPDLLILYRNKWAALECKRSANASHQPNQDYYVCMLDDMSFSRFIYPGNEEEVLDELQRSFQS